MDRRPRKSIETSFAEFPRTAVQGWGSHPSIHPHIHTHAHALRARAPAGKGPFFFSFLCCSSLRISQNSTELRCGETVRPPPPGGMLAPEVIHPSLLCPPLPQYLYFLCTTSSIGYCKYVCAYSVYPQISTDIH